MTLTSRGYGLLAAAAVLFGAGFAFGYPELTALGGAATIAVGCAAGYAAWRPRLAVSRTVEPERVGRGEAATVTLTVHNSGRLRSASLVAEDRCGSRRIPVPLLRLRPGRDTTASYPVPTERRGVVPVGPLQVRHGDALGLASVLRSHGEAARVWVHPRIHPLLGVPAGVARSLDGRLDRVPHGSITFDSLRDYVVGDELRRVHWRTSARVGELMVRENVDTSLPRIVVLLDNRATAHPTVVDGMAETFESACEAAASVVAAATRDELPVTLQLVDGDDAGTPYLDRRPAAPYLDRLAAAELRSRSDPCDGVDPLRAATVRLRQHRLGDTLVFLTGPGGNTDLAAIGALRSTYPVLIVGLFGDAGSPPAADGMLVIAAADGEEFAADWDGARRW
jgi:uncharacterized protein (DUF58 family)